MVGLKVLLLQQEAQKNQYSPTPKKPSQILSKANMLLLPPPPPPFSSLHTPTFLQSCYLCKKQLSQGNDIYMYRGDRAFCSEECRCRQMFMDEETTTREAFATTEIKRKRY